MADIPTYKSTLTGPELDEALRNIGKVQANIEKAAGYAETAEQYGTIVEQNQTAIQAIEDNLPAVQGAAQNATDAKNAAASAAASSSAAGQSAEAAENAAGRAEAAAGVNPNDYYPKTEADQRFQMPVGFYFDWAPVAGNSTDLSTPEKVAEYFGYGTWKEITGVFMLSRSDSHEIGSTGGLEKVSLTGSQIGPHDHEIYVKTSSSPTSVQRAFLNTAYDYNASGVQSSRVPGLIYTSGSGQPHENMPPYLTCYRWQRIA